MGLGGFWAIYKLVKPCNRRWLVEDVSKKHDRTLKQKQSLNRKKKLLAKKFQMGGKVPWQDAPKYHLVEHMLDRMFFGIYQLSEKNILLA